MKAIQNELNIVIDEGFLRVEQAQRSTQTFVDGISGDLGLEDVLEAQGFFFRGDGEQRRAIFLERLQRHLLGDDDEGKIAFDSVVLQGTLHRHLGFHDHLPFVEGVAGMGRKDDVLAG